MLPSAQAVMRARMLPSCSGSSLPARTPARPSVAAAAKKNRQTFEPIPATEGDDDAEARLEAYEQLVRSGKKPTSREYAGFKAAEQAEEDELAAKVVWKVDKLFPEGWDQMTGQQKAMQLYMGERGMLFWSAKIATGSVVALAGTWIIFRFVLPGLGIYEINWAAQ